MAFVDRNNDGPSSSCADQLVNARHDINGQPSTSHIHDETVGSQNSHGCDGKERVSGKEGGGDDCDDAENKSHDFHGGLDTTPLPDAPQGYTVRFVFHAARNLPVTDFHTGSADPYIIATLKTAQPKRHKEDPDMKHRTITRRRTLQPVWDDEWVVSNVPPSGFTLKCRMYDEDAHDKDDRLGNVTIEVDRVSEEWEGFSPPGKWFSAQKRVMSKRAFLLKSLSNALQGGHITPELCVSIQVLGKSDPPFAQICTLGPTQWIQHNSPMIGRLIGTKVNTDEHDDELGDAGEGERKSQKYDFQANEIQLQGPVPSELYHRYYEFRPIIGSLFSSTGIRGKILNKALHRQHRRIYNFGPATERGQFKACSEEASLQFLRMAHFDEGSRTFTYVLTLDGTLRFTETGKEFGIDMLSKHTMHSDASIYIAYSGEFFIRPLQCPDSNEDPEPEQNTHPSDDVPIHSPTPNPSHYQLHIDNDSGTYRPEKTLLPTLKEFLQMNFPGLGIVVMAQGDDRLRQYKKEQREIKKKEGKMMHVVMHKSSSSSLGSIESELDSRDQTWELGRKSKKEAAYAAMVKPDAEHIKEAVERAFLPCRKKEEAE